jgi:cellulose synthase/poly-beta-1,6-N-acetylglucosamine synthase-like glycosyltransferase
VFLPYPSSEQTPGTFKAYYRQRHRWALGQVEIIYKLSKQAKLKGEIGKKARDLQKKLFLYGPGE